MQRCHDNIILIIILLLGGLENFDVIVKRSGKMLRNRFCVPDLVSEGVFLKPLDVPKSDVWNSNQLKPFERMHAHHTLASARRYAFFQPFSDLIPKDELDFILNSPYDHSTEQFPDPIDTYLQADTIGKSTWRRLRNVIEFRPAVEARANIEFRKAGKRSQRLPYKLNKAHPVLVGGISDRKHPSNVKLMNSSHHSPQTNAGYSRQVSDGNFYQY